MKTCYACKEEKKIDEYRGNRRTCKKCANKRKKPKYPYTCSSCGDEYLSTRATERRRKHKLTCASCSTKRSWGDDEYRQKHVDALRAAHNTSDAKKSHSEASKRNFECDEYKKAAVARLNTPEARKKAQQSLLEFWKDEEKFRPALQKMFRTRNRDVECSNGMVKVKSGYEERTIILLDLLGVKWYYEPRSFFLEKMNKVYVPDFYVEDLDLWIEVKGYWYKDAKEKWDTFLEEYPDLNVMIISKKTLHELENGGTFEDYINSQE